MRPPLLPYIALGLGLAAAPLRAEIPDALIQKLKPCVVNISVQSDSSLDGDSPGSWDGTGFIVDAKRGLIATNQHVSGHSPAKYKVRFHNGESTTQARLLYYDPWHDFSFLQIMDMGSLRFPLQEVSFGDFERIKQQSEVFLIGNNEAEEYSVKIGRVTNLILDKGRRHSATFQTSFDRTGGSSGSPVFNAQGEVVGIHFSGTNTSSFELRGDYLLKALSQLQHGDSCLRGEIGCELELIKISDAQKHFQLPESLANEIRAFGKTENRDVAYVQRIIPGSPADGAVRPGDIVVSVNGEGVGPDLYSFDRQVDLQTGSSVDLRLSRNGKDVKVRLQVQDANAAKLKRYAVFAGGVVHDLTLERRRILGIKDAGVLLNQVAPGSSLSIGFKDDDAPNNRRVLILALNSHPTPNLEEFVRQAGQLQDGQAINLTVIDYWSTNQTPQVLPIILNLSAPLQVFEWSQESLQWKGASPNKARGQS